MHAITVENGPNIFQDQARHAVVLEATNRHRQDMQTAASREKHTSDSEDEGNLGPRRSKSPDIEETRQLMHMRTCAALCFGAVASDGPAGYWYPLQPLLRE